MKPIQLFVLVLCLGLLVSGCAAWDVVDHRSRRDVEDAKLEGKKVRVTTSTGTENLWVTRVLYPTLEGKTSMRKEAADNPEMSVNLRRVDLLEVRGVVGGPVLGSLLIAGEIVLFVQLMVGIAGLVLWLSSG